MKLKLTKWKNALQEAITPTSRCLCCGVDIFDGTGFCAKCFKEVTLNNGKTCKRCGVALHGAEDYCSHCAYEETYFDKAYSPFCYGGSVKNAILKMKFGNLATHAKALANYLVYTCQANDLHFDTVTFVPMFPAAQKRRGYNQAQLLAESFCEMLQISPVCALEKVRETERQEMLDKKQRRENLVGAFRAVADVSGKTVLLIDDIKTTGSTLNECAKALKKKGAVSVICLTVASREENVAWEIDTDF